MTHKRKTLRDLPGAACVDHIRFLLKPQVKGHN